ncbi:MAG TPA: aspartate kinase [Holophagaceae bacterium]|nr:aspartate kinase [Holophagaceae bacterium]
MTLKVLKFGGSSVGSPEAMGRAAAIVLEELPQGGLVVVSALKGSTDRILEAVVLAGKGDAAQARLVQEVLEAHHRKTASALGLLEDVREVWAPIFERLAKLLGGMAMLGEATPRARDAALAVGETLSAHLFAALLAQRGARASFREVGEVLHTDARFGQARPHLPAIRKAAQAWARELNSGATFVTQGFLGAAPDGAITTLGRGGSDTSASLLGEALDAAEVQIWTDVDGVLSADPSLVPEARPIPVMSLAEATSLTAFGAKVLHPDSLAPIARSGIRLVVANTLRPHASRTAILPEAAIPLEGRGEGVVSVAYKEGLVILRLPASRSLLADATARAAQVEEAGAHRFGFLVTPEGALIVLRPETPAARQLLTQWQQEGLELEEGWAVVALVGEGLRKDPAAKLRLLEPLGADAGAIGGLLAGCSTISTAALVREHRLADLIPRLHRAWVETSLTSASV